MRSFWFLVISRVAYYVYYVFDFDRDDIMFFSYIFHLWEKIPKKKLGIDVKEKLKLEIGEIIL